MTSSSASFNDTPLQSTDDSDHSVKVKCLDDDVLSAVADAKFTVEMPSSDDFTICIRVVPPAQPATPPAPESEPAKGWVDQWKNATAAMKQRMEETDQADFILNELMPVLEIENALLNRPRFVRQFPTMLAAGLTKAHLQLLFEKGLLMASNSFLVMLLWQALQDNKDAKRIEIVNYLQSLLSNDPYTFILELLIPVSSAGGITFDILEQPASKLHATHLENLCAVKELKRVLQSREPFSVWPGGFRFDLTLWFLPDICQQHDDLLKAIGQKAPSISLPILLLCLSSMIPTREEEVELAKVFMEKAKALLPDDSIFLDEWMQSGGDQVSRLQRAQWKVQGLSNVAKQGNLEAVKYLVEKCGADVHAYGEGALILSSCNGHLEVIKYLVLEKGANVHAKGEQALRNASWHGHLDVVRYLVEEGGADVHADNDDALQRASKNGHLEVVRYLVENGASVHAREGEALRCASWKGHLEVVRYLVEEGGADVHVFDDGALRLASKNGHDKVVCYLLEKGANVHVLKDYALTIASENGHLEVVRYLVENGADVHASDDAPLRWASRNGYVQVVRYLVETGKADVYAMNEESLLWARQYGHLDVVKYLESII